METKPKKTKRTNFVRRPIAKQPKAPKNIENMVVAAAMTMGLGDITTVRTRLGNSSGTAGMAPLRTTRKYYRNNWEMLQHRPELYAPVEETVSRILGPGVCIVDKGMLMQPEGEFADLFRDLIEPCLARAIRWLVCYAYVVWADALVNIGEPAAEGDTAPQKQKHIVFIPDPDQVKVEFSYNKLTGAPETRVEWASEDIDARASRLHFFSESVLGITAGYQASPIDAASSIVDSIVSVRIAFHRILERIASAPIGVEDHQKTSGPAPSPLLAELQPDAIERFLDAEQLAIRDSTARERINTIINSANDDAENDIVDAPQLFAPEDRLARAVAEPVENAFVPIPPGMRAASIQPPAYFTDFNATDERLMRQVARLMGMEAAAAPVSNKNKEGTLSPAAGAGGAFTDRQKAWQKALSELATRIIGTLYPGSGYRVILMSQVYPDRDLCQQLVAQGAMSEETFRGLHPNTLIEEQQLETKAQGAGSKKRG